jgi:hypothetical protein
MPIQLPLLLLLVGYGIAGISAWNFCFRPKLALRWACLLAALALAPHAQALRRRAQAWGTTRRLSPR